MVPGRLLTHHCANIITCDLRLVEGPAYLSLSSGKTGTTEIDDLSRMSNISYTAAPVPTLGPSTVGGRLRHGSVCAGDHTLKSAALFLIIFT